MDLHLELDDDQLQLREATKALLADQLDAAAVRRYVDESAPGAPSAAWWRRGAEVGWTSLLLPEPWGAGATVADLVVVAEELGRALFPGALVGATAAGLVLASSLRSTASQTHRQLLGSLADGSRVVGWCPLPPTRPGAAPMRLTETGSALVLAGRARYVQDADVAAAFVVGVPDGDGLSHLLVDATAPGVSVQRSGGLDLTRRFFDVTFEEVRLTPEAVLGERRAGTGLAGYLRLLAATLLAADAVGGCAELTERTVRYAEERIAFGRPIASYQAVKHKCADMLVWTESARVATYAAALALDTQPIDEASRAVAVAKAYAGETYPRLTGESLQIHGGIGFAWEHDCHLFMRRARADEVLFGSPRIYRDQLVATLG